MNQAVQVALVVGVIILVIYLLRNSALGKLIGGAASALNGVLNGVWSGTKWVGGALSTVFGDHRNKGTPTSQICYTTFCGCQPGAGYDACAAACDKKHGAAIKDCIAESDARKKVPPGQTTVAVCFGKICGCTKRGKAFRKCSEACDRDHGQEIAKCIATDNGRIPYVEVPVTKFPPATTRDAQIAALKRIVAMLTALRDVDDPSAEIATAAADRMGGYAAAVLQDMYMGASTFKTIDPGTAATLAWKLSQFNRNSYLSRGAADGSGTEESTARFRADSQVIAGLAASLVAA